MAVMMGDNADENPECKKRRMRVQLLDEMRLASTSTSIDTPSDVAMEVTNYLTMRCAGAVYDDTLNFWQRHASTFPTLSQLAKLYLAMSSASVPVESMFSTTGLILNGKRCMLGAEKLNKISFVHDNQKYLLGLGTNTHKLTDISGTFK